MKKAIKCFKYLLVNGFDDPNKTMEDQSQNPDYKWAITSRRRPKIFAQIKIKRFKWDCMTTAIFFGHKEIIKILEEKGIEKGKNPTHIEAAILSYRNFIAKEIIEDLNENNQQIQNILIISITASAKNNNIKGVEFLMNKGVDINTYDKQFNSFLKIKHHFILQQRIIQKR